MRRDTFPPLITASDIADAVFVLVVALFWPDLVRMVCLAIVAASQALTG